MRTKPEDLLVTSTVPSSPLIKNDQNTIRETNVRNAQMVPNSGKSVVTFVNDSAPTGNNTIQHSLSPAAIIQPYGFKYIPRSNKIRCNSCMKLYRFGNRFHHLKICDKGIVNSSIDYSDLYYAYTMDKSSPISESSIDENNMAETTNSILTKTCANNTAELANKEGDHLVVCPKCTKVLTTSSLQRHTIRCFPETNRNLKTNQQTKRRLEKLKIQQINPIDDQRTKLPQLQDFYFETMENELKVYKCKQCGKSKQDSSTEMWSHTYVTCPFTSSKKFMFQIKQSLIESISCCLRKCNDINQPDMLECVKCCEKIQLYSVFHHVRVGCVTLNNKHNSSQVGCKKNGEANQVAYVRDYDFTYIQERGSVKCNRCNGFLSIQATNRHFRICTQNTSTIPKVDYRCLFMTIPSVDSNIDKYRNNDSTTGVVTVIKTSCKACTSIVENDDVSLYEHAKICYPEITVRFQANFLKHMTVTHRLTAKSKIFTWTPHYHRTIMTNKTTAYFRRRDIITGLYTCNICLQSYPKQSLRYHIDRHDNELSKLPNSNKTTLTTNDIAPNTDTTSKSCESDHCDHSASNHTEEEADDTRKLFNTCKFKYISELQKIQCNNCNGFYQISNRFHHSMSCYKTRGATVDFSSLFVTVTNKSYGKTSEESANIKHLFKCKKCSIEIYSYSLHRHVYKCDEFLSKTIRHIAYNNHNIKNEVAMKNIPVSQSSPNDTSRASNTRKCRRRNRDYFYDQDSQGRYKCKRCGRLYKYSSLGYHKNYHDRLDNKMPVLRLHTTPVFPCCSCKFNTTDPAEMTAHFQSKAHPTFTHDNNFIAMDHPLVHERTFSPDLQLYSCFICGYTTTDIEITRVCQEIHFNRV